MDTSTLKKAYVCNLIIAVLAALSVAWLFSGWEIGGSGNLMSSHWGMLRYYTVDSNLLMGIIALIAALEQRSVLQGKRPAVRPCMYVLMLLGTVGVTLTMLVTVFFLAPTAGSRWWTLFANSSAFLHLITPLLCIFTFLRLERSRSIPLRHTFTGISSMAVYAVYYVGNCVVHAEGNYVPPSADWYGFLMLGMRSIVVVLPVILLITYGISFALWRLNRGNKSSSNG